MSIDSEDWGEGSTYVVVGIDGFWFIGGESNPILFGRGLVVEEHRHIDDYCGPGCNIRVIGVLDWEYI